MKLIQTYLIYKGANELRFLYNTRKYLKNLNNFTRYGTYTPLKIKDWVAFGDYTQTPRRYVFKCS